MDTRGGGYNGRQEARFIMGRRSFTAEFKEQAARQVIQGRAFVSRCGPRSGHRRVIAATLGADARASWCPSFSPTHWLTARDRTQPSTGLEHALHPVPSDGRDARPLTSFRASITLQTGRLEYLNTACAAPEPFFAWCNLAATPSA